MRAHQLLTAALLSLTIACGSDTTSNDDDPGEPSLSYGTKAGGDGSVGGNNVGRLFFTFLAPDEPDRARMFARPDYNGGEGVKHYYLSLVFDDARWAEGHYREARAGRVEVELDDGRRYAGNARELSAHVHILRTNVIEGAHYPVGYLELIVPAQQAGADPLQLDLTISNPEDVTD